MINFKFSRGQTLIEILVAIGIASIILPALLTGFISSREGKVQQKKRLEAVSILKETQEAIRSIREKGWINVSTNGTYHPQIAADNSWELVTGLQVVGDFTRQLVISDVFRDATGAIVDTGGILDPSMKKVTTTISWNLPYASSVTSTSYIARLYNLSHTETLGLHVPLADFDLGTKTGITVTKTIDGEFVLSSGTQGSDWCQPATPSALTSFDLPKSGVANAVTAITAPTGDTVFAGTGNNSSGVSFQKVSVSNANPPVPSGGATFDGYKTNAVFGDSGYAYLATDNNSKEIVIMNLNQYSDPPTNSKYLEVGNINLPGNGNGDSIYVIGNLAYVTGSSIFYIYDITNKASPVLQNTGGLTLAGTGNKVIVVNSKAYIAINSTSTQLQIIDVSDPSSLPSPINISVTGQAGKDVFVNSSGTRAYLATGTSSSQKEFFIVNVDSTSAQYKQTLGSFDTNGMNPKGVTVVTNNKAIIVGIGGKEYQVIDITDETNPSPCNPAGELDIDTGVNGVAGILQADGDAYSYIITGDANAELKIIPGGAGGGGGYVTEGTFESQTIPIPIPVDDTSFNRFQVLVGRPSQTNIYFQIAVAQAVNNSCDSVAFNYVGTGGTSSTFFETSVTNGQQTFGYSIPPSINPGRCFRYKAYLSTTDSTQTPTFYQIDVNYSP